MTYQVFEAKPFALHPIDHRRHLSLGVQPPLVVTTGELVDLALQILGTHVMVSPDVPALEDSPERLNRVGVNLPFTCWLAECLTVLCGRSRPTYPPKSSV